MAGGSRRKRKARAKPDRAVPFALAAGAVLAANRAEAATFTVTNPNDSGAGSLRQAVSDASATGGANVIVFDPTVFATAQTIRTRSELFFPASGALTIQGPGASLLTLTRDPGAVHRFFSTSTPSLTISGVTMMNFTPGTQLGAERGGAVWVVNGGSLTLVDSVLTGNLAVYGGAVGAIDGFVHLDGCTITNNFANSGGGAVSIEGTSGLLVENSTIVGNSASGGQGGGGLFVVGTVATSPPAGFTPGTVVIRNSTLWSNNGVNAARGAGVMFGVFRLPVNGTLLVQDSTITGNTAVGPGGGISAYYGSGAITLANSILSGNSTSYGDTYGPDLYGSPSLPLTANYSAIGTIAGVPFSAASGNNLAPGTNLMMGPFTNNGGATPTLAPLPGSPLINAGSNALVPVDLTSDQRKPPYARIYGPAVDIGAVEAQPQLTPVPAGDAKHLAILAAALAGAALARLRKSRVTGSG
jgi:hypothetical protein